MSALSSKNPFFKSELISDFCLLFPVTLKTFSALLLLSLLGCQAPNHGLVGQGSAGISGGVPPGSPKPNERILFSAVASTNQVRPEWLGLPKDFFRLGPGDSFEIELLGEPGPPSTVSVGPDGKIYYSLLNGEFVWGLTLTEARSLLETNLAKFLRTKPEVTLTLKSVGSRRVWILGSVQKPGVYPLAAPLTLLEAISAAGGAVAVPGGPEASADLENSFVIRHGNWLGVDFQRLLQRGDLSQNVYLQPDDFVYLRSGVSRGDVYVLGAVAGPNIVDYKEHLSLLSAISSVGGPIEYAYRSHIAVLRGSLAHPTIAIFDYDNIINGKALDVPLEPGDVVYIPFSPFRRVEQFLDEILNNFVRTIAVNEGQRAVLQNSSPVGLAIPLTVAPGGR